jgi:uncharacterized membrane protein
MTRSWLLVLVMTAAPLRAEEFPALYAVTGVAAGDRLNIRAAPDAAAPVIGTLAPDATGIEVFAISDGWASVNGTDTGGYASAGFLARTPGPDWNALATPLTCLGTEPFWSLEIDPAAQETRFNTPDDAEGRTSAIRMTWPGQPFARAAAVALPDGLAVLQPEECSDGMSELVYGISVDVFLQGQDRTRLSGCCRMASE